MKDHYDGPQNGSNPEWVADFLEESERLVGLPADELPENLNPEGAKKQLGAARRMAANVDRLYMDRVTNEFRAETGAYPIDLEQMLDARIRGTKIDDEYLTGHEAAFDEWLAKSGIDPEALERQVSGEMDSAFKLSPAEYEETRNRKPATAMPPGYFEEQNRTRSDDSPYKMTDEEVRDAEHAEREIEALTKDEGKDANVALADAIATLAGAVLDNEKAKITDARSRVVGCLIRPEDAINPRKTVNRMIDDLRDAALDQDGERFADRLKAFISDHADLTESQAWSRASPEIKRASVAGARVQVLADAVVDLGAAIEAKSKPKMVTAQTRIEDALIMADDRRAPSETVEKMVAELRGAHEAGPDALELRVAETIGRHTRMPEARSRELAGRLHPTGPGMQDHDGRAPSPGLPPREKAISRTR